MRRIRVEVVQWTPKKCTKKRNARHSELLSLNQLFFSFFFFHVGVVVFVIVVA